MKKEELNLNRKELNIFYASERDVIYKENRLIKRKLLWLLLVILFVGATDIISVWYIRLEYPSKFEDLPMMSYMFRIRALLVLIIILAAKIFILCLSRFFARNGAPDSNETVKSIQSILNELLVDTTFLKERKIILYRSSKRTHFPEVIELSGDIIISIPMLFGTIVQNNRGLAKSILAHELGHVFQGDTKLWLYSKLSTEWFFRILIPLQVLVVFSIFYFLTGRILEDWRLLWHLSWLNYAQIAFEIYLAHRIYKLRKRILVGINTSEHLADLFSLLKSNVPMDTFEAISFAKEQSQRARFHPSTSERLKSLIDSIEITNKYDSFERRDLYQHIIKKDDFLAEAFSPRRWLAVIFPPLRSLAWGWIVLGVILISASFFYNYEFVVPLLFGMLIGRQRAVEGWGAEILIASGIACFLLVGLSFSLLPMGIQLKSLVMRSASRLPPYMTSAHLYVLAAYTACFCGSFIGQQTNR